MRGRRRAGRSGDPPALLSGFHTMRVDSEQIKRFLLRRDFAGLFNYLGWDRPRTLSFPLPLEGAQAAPAADKRGVAVWSITGVLTAMERRRIDRELSRLSRERLLIFDEGNRQRWLWPEMRPSGSGYRLVEHEYWPGAANEGLVQRLAGVCFDISEEDGLTVLDVLDRVRRQFNVEPVTKRFFKEFKANHLHLAEKIEGIDPEEHRRWYGSVLLNRLMFIYFLQKKGFMAGDIHYLRNRLEMVRSHLGEDAFYGFFRRFLLPLFHEGLGSHRQLYDDPVVGEIIGGIPYVNGAIFDPHQLEQEHDIQIPDRAFEIIFDFFDGYRWHLDERPTYEPNEINPDVLGYVFEQYVNQKEQGAYYTKEDITGYMTSVTVIPALLDRLRLDDDPMDLLEVEPDRYIHESVFHGIDEQYPPEIAAGLDDPALRDELWFDKAPPEIGLPGETWWEADDRLRRCRELRARLAAGRIENVDEAVTANLDLRTLVTDFLAMLTPLEAVESAYRTLTEITVLDPTCGSGAFLFSALDILAECYEVLLDRADELSSGLDDRPLCLREADEHPNRRYFILKSVMLNNLYGVDLMPEAGEIARLRMFLKLAAQLIDHRQIEPLPDLDFNIKTGNLLVGIAHQKDAEDRIGMDLLGLGQLEDIATTNAAVAELMSQFSLAQQRTDDPARILELKAGVEEKLAEHRRRLDQALYEARAERMDLDRWIESHRPFHWFIEFPRIFKDGGGFDIIIGNPPFISRTKITSYSYQGYQTNNLSNIYAPCVERTLHLLGGNAYFTMVLPISFQFSDRFELLRTISTDSFNKIWISTYGKRPDRLFKGAQQRIVIMIGKTIAHNKSKQLSTTRFLRWVKEYRPFLFQGLTYTIVPDQIRTEFGWVKLGSPQERILLQRLLDYCRLVGSLTESGGDYSLSYKGITYNYLSVFIDVPPAVDASGQTIRQPKIGKLSSAKEKNRDISFVLLLSKTALLWWAATGDGFNVTKSGLCSTPVVPQQEELLKTLAGLVSEISYKLNQTLGFAKNAEKVVGNYDARLIRDLTDQVDKLILRYLNLDLEEYWPALQLFTIAFGKSTGRASDLHPWSYFFPDLPDPRS